MGKRYADEPLAAGSGSSAVRGDVKVTHDDRKVVRWMVYVMSSGKLS